MMISLSLHRLHQHVAKQDVSVPSTLVPLSTDGKSKVKLDIGEMLRGFQETLICTKVTTILVKRSSALT